MMGIFKFLFAVYIIRTFVTFISKHLDKETLSFPRMTNLHLSMDAFNKKNPQAPPPRFLYPVMFSMVILRTVLLCCMTLISFLLTWWCPHSTRITVNTTFAKLRGLCGLRNLSKEQKECSFSLTGNSAVLALLGAPQKPFRQEAMRGGINLFSSKLLFRKSSFAPCGTPCVILCLDGHVPLSRVPLGRQCPGTTFKSCHAFHSERPLLSLSVFPWMAVTKLNFIHPLPRYYH